MKIWIIPLMLLIMLFGAACSLGQNPTEQALTPMPQDSEPVETDNESPPMFNGGAPPPNFTQSYTHEPMGLTFGYPDGWVVESSNDALIQLYSRDPSTIGGPGGGGFPMDATKIEFIPAISGGAYSTIDEFITFHQNNEPDGPGGEFLSAQWFTLPSGLTAARVEFRVASPSETLIRPILLVDVDGQLIIITGYGDTTRFDEILGTLRPAP